MIFIFTLVVVSVDGHHRLGGAGVAVPGRLHGRRRDRGRARHERLGPRPPARASRSPGFAGLVAAVLVGLPALRVKGLFLAVTTLGFGVAASSWLLNPRFFDWIPSGRIERPDLLGQIDLNSPTRIYYFSLAVVVADAPRPHAASGTAAPVGCCSPCGRTSGGPRPTA